MEASSSTVPENLYGMTELGGPSDIDSGVVFKLTRECGWQLDRKRAPCLSGR